MLNTSSDFAGSNNLVFNASNVKYMYFNNTGSQLHNTVKIMS